MQGTSTRAVAGVGEAMWITCGAPVSMENRDFLYMFVCRCLYFTIFVDFVILVQWLVLAFMCKVLKSCTKLYFVLCFCAKSKRIYTRPTFFNDLIGK